MKKTFKPSILETSFPLKEVSIISGKEKNIHQGNITAIHLWWARRPLAASRATAYSALVSSPENIIELEKEKQFIINYANWENANNPDYMNKAKDKILRSFNGNIPKVLDPFGGGGSLPAESLRLGCETYSNDLNPVAVLTQKCTLEYPQKYGKPGYVERDFVNLGKKQKERIHVENVLLEDIRFWSDWIAKEVNEEISEFYPKHKKYGSPMGYLWARTVPCQNPACGTEIPLIKQYWLSNKNGKKVILLPVIKRGKIDFKIVGDGYSTPIPDAFDPEDGTVNRANVKCLACGNTISGSTTRKLFADGKAGHRLLAVIYKTSRSCKTYKVAEEEDNEILETISSLLNKKTESLFNILGINPIPDEETPSGKGQGAERAFSVQNYGMYKWGDLFNERQKLGILTYIEKILQAEDHLSKCYDDKEYVRAILTYLSFNLEKIIERSTTLCRWLSTSENIIATYSRQALPIVWDYAESNISEASPNNSFYLAINNISNIINSHVPVVTQASATELPYPDNYFDAIFTDPPYYDNIPYSYLSDFFFVWQKRTIGRLFPDLFTTNLTPKKNEIVAYSNLPGGFEEGKKFFEDMLSKAFKEINRTLKPNGIAIIVYAHKSTEGWETLINSILYSGLVITAAWPINTEMGNRLRSMESAALASSIYIVCRKLERQPTAMYNNVKEELQSILPTKLDELWNLGIGGADFFISAIGFSIQVFGMYDSIIDFEGNVIRADKLLSDVRIIVTDYAVKKILSTGFISSISDLTRFYVLCRWEFGPSKIPFDEANKLAHSCHLELGDYWLTHGFIVKDKEFVQILGPHERKLDDLRNSIELIDVLHYAIKLWEIGNKSEMQLILNQTGYSKNDTFFRIAQAIAETLPGESKEKKLLEGFLNLREKISENFIVNEKDKDLFDK